MSGEAGESQGGSNAEVNQQAEAGAGGEQSQQAPGLTPNEAPQDDQGSLQAGFEAVRGKKEPGGSSPDSNSARPEGEPSPQGEQSDPAPQEERPKPVLAGYTEDEIRTLLTKAARVDEVVQTNQKLAGHVGQLRQTIDELRKSTRGGTKPISQAQFKRLEAELGPDIAKAISEDLGEILGPADDATQKPEPTKAEQSPQQTQTAAAIDPEALKGEVLLEVKHPDWVAKMASPDFAAWLAVIRPEVSQAVQSSSDGKFIAQALDEFSKWRNAQKPGTGDSQPPGNNPNRSRLNRAIPPKGTGAVTTVIPDEEGLTRGFNQVRSQRLR